MKKSIGIFAVLPILVLFSGCEKQKKTTNENQKSSEISSINPNIIELSNSNYMMYFEISTYCAYSGGGMFYYKYLEIKGALSSALYNAKITYVVNNGSTSNTYQADVNAGGHYLSPGYSHTADILITWVIGTVELLRSN